MSIPLVVNGITFNYPTNGEVGWGTQATGWANAITNGVLQKTGGLFPLTGDVDFGPSGGLKAVWFSSRTIPSATTGVFRLANNEFIGWRNAANTGNATIGLNALDNYRISTATVPDAAVITADGKVGIGTTTFIGGAKLQVSAPDDARIVLAGTANNSNSGGTLLFFRNGISTGRVGTSANSLGDSTNNLFIQGNENTVFHTGSGFGTEIMRITGTGLVGVGTKNPVKKLQVSSPPDLTTRTNGLQSAIDTPGLTPVQVNDTSFGIGANGIVENFAGDLHIRSFWGVSIDKRGGNTSTGAQNSVGPDATSFMVRQSTSTNTWTTQFLVNQAGNVGVGTTLPAYQLQVTGGGQATGNPTDAGGKGGSLYLQTTGNAANSGGALYLGTDTGAKTPFAAIKGLLWDGAGNTMGAIAFGTRVATANTSITEHMRITQDGRVGIGITDPSKKLVVMSPIDLTTASNGLQVATTNPGMTPAQINNTAIGLGTGGILENNAGYLHIRSFWGVSIDKRGGNLSGTAPNSVGPDSISFVVRQTTSPSAWDTQFVVSGGGNVGVGIASPSTRLDVSSPGQTIARFASESTLGAFITVGNAATASRTILGNGANVLPAMGVTDTGIVSEYGAVAFGANNAERGRFTTNGSFLVGSTDAALNTETAWVGFGGAALPNTSVFHIPASGTTGWVLQGYYRGASQIGSIQYNGTGVNFVTTSDIRIKENIVDAQSAGDKIDGIKIREYDHIGGDHVAYGFIAQELVEVAPQAVSIGGEDPLAEPWGVDYSKLVPLLIKEIQELRARVAALEA
jgi:hypothetical protein